MRGGVTTEQGVMPSEKASAGFEGTYRELRLPLLRFAYLLSGSRETSEDVLQTAFTSLNRVGTSSRITLRT